MTQGYVFSGTSFIASLIISAVMGMAWVAGQLVKGCIAIDKQIDSILEGCL